MPSEILPCPFCKNDNLKVDSLKEKSDFYVACLTADCEADGPVKQTRDEAIIAWNKGTTPNALH